MPGTQFGTCSRATVAPLGTYIDRQDAGLLTALRSGSHAAFEELQKAYSDRLYKRILSITRNHADAEDALQDTFMRAFVGLDSFEGRSQLSTWLTRIAFNSALMIIRRRRTGEVFAPQADSAVHDFDIRDSAPNPEEICDRKQRLNRMFSAIERLEPISRTAIRIRITQESSMKEIADTLDVSLAAVKAKLHRARKKLAHNVHQNELTRYSHVGRRNGQNDMPLRSEDGLWPRGRLLFNRAME
jgi:RNA polymerase sigma-70 factor, ECF subfamily